MAVETETGAGPGAGVSVFLTVPHAAVAGADAGRSVHPFDWAARERAMRVAELVRAALPAAVIQVFASVTPRDDADDNRVGGRESPMRRALRRHIARLACGAVLVILDIHSFPGRIMPPDRISPPGFLIVPHSQDRADFRLVDAILHAAPGLAAFEPDLVEGGASQNDLIWTARREAKARGIRVQTVLVEFNEDAAYARHGDRLAIAVANGAVATAVSQ